MSLHLIMSSFLHLTARKTLTSGVYWDKLQNIVDEREIEIVSTLTTTKESKAQLLVPAHQETTLVIFATRKRVVCAAK